MILSLLTNLIVCAADFLKEALLFKYIFLYNFRLTKKRGIIAVIVSISIIGFSSITYAAKYISIIYLPLIYGILLLFLQEKEKRSAVYFFISYVCVCQMDILISTLMKLAFSPALEEDTIQLITALFSVAVVYTLCKICYHFHIKIANRKLNVFVIVQVIILCLVVLLIGTVSNVAEANSDIFYGRMLILITCALSIIISLLGFVLYSVIRANRYYHELEIMNKKYLEIQSKYYEQIQKQNRAIRKYRHDMQSHFICFNHFLLQNDIDKAKNYMKEMHYDLEQTKMEYDVGNEVASVILNDKGEDLKKYQIEMKVEGKLPANISMSDYDFCNIFSNLLNNAVEACKRVDKNRKIKIRLGVYNKFISIWICNSCNKKEISLKTSKQDKDNHGYGISKIQEYVSRYDGNMKIELQQGNFIVDIILKCL